jgi:hypothetical protein
VQRLVEYEAVYETIELGDDSEGGGTRPEQISFIKLIDVGRQLLTNNIVGYLPTQIVTYLMNTKVQPPTVWLTRHGESEANVRPPAVR